MSASVDRDARIARWNKYKSQAEAAGTRVIRATQFLVHPLDGFTAYSVHEIKPLWDMWAEQNEIFHRMTLSDTFTEPVFPKMPAIDAEECCFKMWGLLIQVQIDGTHGSTDFLYETVREIAKNEKCKSHPATCSCHVPDHPWVYPEDIAALAPINPLHHSDCKCGGMERTNWCRQPRAAAVAAAAAAAAVAEVNTSLAAKLAPYITRGFPSEFCNCDTQYVSCTCGKPDKDNVDRAMLLDATGNLAPEMGQALCGKGWTKPVAQPSSQEPVAQRCEHGFIHCVVCPDRSTQPLLPKYTHRVDECACGTCHKARVDSGTQEAYERKVRDRANIVLSSLRTYESVSCGITQLIQASVKADQAIAKATIMSGGGPDKPDFAKNLFAAMGTPHDSKCPHGLPFYACMPCSH
jgi:hypothetical protein